MPYNTIKCFDKEVLLDVLQELHSNVIDPTANRRFFMLNENTNVRIGCTNTSTKRLGTCLVRGVVEQEKSVPEPVTQAGHIVGE